MNNNTSAFNALEYDEKIKKTLPYYEDFYKQIIDIVKIQFNKSVAWLDVGCGTGKMAETALGTIDIKRFVFCDNSANMTEIAKQRFESANTEFTTTSILELHDNTQFDVITAIQVFHYFEREERIRAIKKCHEMLRTNGILLHLKILRLKVKSVQNYF